MPSKGISKYCTRIPNARISITFKKTGRVMKVDAVADAYLDEWELVCCYWPISKRDRNRKVYDETYDFRVNIQPEDRRRIIDPKLYTYDPCEVDEKATEHWERNYKDPY